MIKNIIRLFVVVLLFIVVLVKVFIENQIDPIYILILVLLGLSMLSFTYSIIKTSKKQ